MIIKIGYQQVKQLIGGKVVGHLTSRFMKLVALFYLAKKNVINVLCLKKKCVYYIIVC